MGTFAEKEGRKTLATTAQVRLLFAVGTRVKQYLPRGFLSRAPPGLRVRPTSCAKSVVTYAVPGRLPGGPATSLDVTSWHGKTVWLNRAARPGRPAVTRLNSCHREISGERRSALAVVPGTLPERVPKAK